MTTTISADNGTVSGSAGLKSSADSSGILQFQTGANTAALTIDASQNVGLGVTPSAWGSIFKVLQFGGGAFVGQNSSVALQMGHNVYFNGTSYVYSTTGLESTRYVQNVTHAWYTAPSGTAGNAITFTQAMTLDASGNLIVGGTTANAGIGNTSTGAGIGIGSGAYLNASRNAGASLYLNRNTSDGTVAYFQRSGSIVGSIDVTTVLTTYNTTSDYRLKNNQAPLTGSGAFIDALQPKTWNWAQDGSKGAGFIAHEFAKVSSSSVNGEKDAVDSDGQPVYQTMQASSAEVIANLVAEIQSLRKRLADAGIA